MAGIKNFVSILLNAIVSKGCLFFAKLKGLVISGEYDKTIDPVNSKHIANTFLKLGADIQKKELKMGHEFPKISRDVINEWMAQNK